MNIRQFEYVQEIAKCKSITLAAQNLFISQQALSETLKLLEEELNFSIFNRSKKGVKLTAEGEMFLKDIDKILKMVHRWDILAKKQNGTFEIKIIVQNLIRDLILIDNLKESIEQKGKFVVQWDTDSIPHMIKRLSSNDPCVVIMTFSPQSIVYPKIMQLKSNGRYVIKSIASEEDSEMQLILRKDDPLVQKETIQISDLSGKCIAVNEGVSKTDFLSRLIEATNNPPYILPYSINAVDFIMQRKGYIACLPKFIAVKNVHIINGNAYARKIANNMDKDFKCYLLSNIENGEIIDVITEEMNNYLLSEE